MAKLKEFNNKIKSLKNTQKITKTMKMVSVSKLRKAQIAQSQAKAYARNIESLVSRISASVDETTHPLLSKRASGGNVHIIVVTSDKGLCGSFNINANKKVLEWTRQHKSEYKKIDLSFCGKKGWQAFHKIFPVREYYQNVTMTPKFSDAQTIGRELIKNFLSGQDDEVYITYNQFFSPLSQKTVFERILPLDPKELMEAAAVQASSEYIYEPQQAVLLNHLVEHFVFFKIYFALLENSAGEHGARMTAMDNATKNAKEMIGKYTLLRNRARQAAITTELTEIVAGAEALN